MSLRTLQGKLLASLLLGLAVVIVMGLVSDASAVWRDLGAFRWAWLPSSSVSLPLTTCSAG